jgi:hypothetical protein
MSARKAAIPDVDVRVDAGTYRFRHDWDGGPELGTTILRVLQTITDDEVREQVPLARYVDPEALDRLFAPISRDRSRDRGAVSFRYAGASITVEATGEVVIAPDSRGDAVGERDSDD